METEAKPTQMPLNWFEIWRISFLHPTIKTYSRIISDPRASIKWSLIWAAITTLIVWVVGPQREILGGYLANVIGGRQTFFYVSLIGAPVAVILGVLGLVFVAAIMHGVARLFSGAGSFLQLFFCWAVMQLPFILLAGLVVRIPLGFPPSREFLISRIGLIIQYSKLLVALCIYLYLFYAQVVAFSAVEKFGIGKSLGIVILSGVVVGIIGTCLSFGFQAVMMNFFRY